MRQDVHQLFPELGRETDTEEARQLLTEAGEEASHIIEDRAVIRLPETMPHRARAAVEVSGWHIKYATSRILGDVSAPYVLRPASEKCPVVQD